VSEGRPIGENLLQSRVYDHSVERKQNPEIVGVVLVLLAAVSLCFALREFSELKWGDGQIGVFVAISFLVIAFWVRRKSRKPD